MALDAYNIAKLVAARSQQRTYHLVSERHLRVEFRNLARGEVVEKFVYAGDVMLTCYRGAFAVTAGGTSAELTEMDQLVIPEGTPVSIACERDGSLQLVWSPAFAPTERGG